MLKENNIVLNCVPPTSLDKPAIGLEVLKSHMQNSSFSNVEVIYWNCLFYEAFTKRDDVLQLKNVKDDINFILPFFCIIAEQNNDNIAKNKILLKLQELQPSYKSLGGSYYEKLYHELIDITIDVIDNKLSEIINKDILIFGISAKYDGWIASYVLAMRLKKNYPNIKCVLGGFEDFISLNTILEKYDVFDFGIWGEGEIPLKELCECLINNESFSNVPRLLFKHEGSIKVSKGLEENSYINLDEYILEFKDYFQQVEPFFDKKDIYFPIETSRSCRWNNCNFCALNWGNSYRTRSVAKITEQIQHNYNDFKILNYFFVDNDIVGKDRLRFNKLLDSLIKLSLKINVDFNFIADILHLNLDNKLIKKMSLAGFKCVQIGYEAITDSMLKKLNKATTFADNILFMKFAIDYDIEASISGLIVGIPNETESDINESANNLHFLRFFLNDKGRRPFTHMFAELVLFYKTNFWNMLSEEERYSFRTNSTLSLLPENYIEDEDAKYSILGLTKKPILREKWESFLEISKHYEKTNFEYFILENNGNINYIEYCDNLKVDAITFDEPIYWDVLSLSNNKVISFSKLYVKMQEKYPNISKEKLRTVMESLKDKYLLYYSDNFSKIISIINTDKLT